jgi:molybdate transport system regulatory protein
MSSLIVRIDLGTHGRVGPGKLMLLQKVEELGSISAAGRAMKMSYRQAWGLIDQLNHAFQEPVVISQTGGKAGGGAHLTDFGKLLLTHCNAIIGNARRSAQPHLEFIDAVLSRSEPPPPALEQPAKGTLRRVRK